MVTPSKRRTLRSPQTWLAIAGALLILAVVAANVIRSRETSGVSVKTAVIEQRLFEDDALVSGSTEALQLSQIVAPFSAKLLKYDVREGDRFAAGQVLAEMDTTDVEKQAREAKAALQVAETQRDQAYHPCTPADLAEAKANVTASQAAYDIATDTLERDRTLCQNGAVSQTTVDQDQGNQTQTMYSLKTAEAGLKTSKTPILTNWLSAMPKSNRPAWRRMMPPIP